MDSDGVTVSLPSYRDAQQPVSIGEKWMVLHSHDKFRLRMLKLCGGAEIFIKCPLARLERPLWRNWGICFGPMWKKAT